MFRQPRIEREVVGPAVVIAREVADATREVRVVGRLVEWIAARHGKVGPVVGLRVEVAVEAGRHVPGQSGSRGRQAGELHASGQWPVEVDDDLVPAIVAGRPFVELRIELVLGEVLEVLDVAERFGERVRHAQRRPVLRTVLHAAQERGRPGVSFHAELNDPANRRVGSGTAGEQRVIEVAVVELVRAAAVHAVGRY